jgi:hypothetical protein
METQSDEIGNILREFYNTYGMPGEGPPQDFNVTALLGNQGLLNDIKLLRTAIDDQKLRQKFSSCQRILKELALCLDGEDLLEEVLNSVSLSKQELDDLQVGQALFIMADSLNQRQDGLPSITPFDGLDVPAYFKIGLVIQGSLILRLYVALVYMREGIMNDLINKTSRAGNPCAGRAMKLLNSDYVRHIRNSLSHGTFSTSIAGIVFRDEDVVIFATPRFMNWLCAILNLIHVRVLSAATTIVYKST